VRALWANRLNVDSHLSPARDRDEEGASRVGEAELKGVVVLISDEGRLPARTEVEDKLLWRDREVTAENLAQETPTGELLRTRLRAPDPLALRLLRGTGDGFALVQRS